MGVVAFAFFGLIHLAILPLLILVWIVLRLARYSVFTGPRWPFQKLPYTIEGSASPSYAAVIDVVETECARGRTIGMQFFASVRNTVVSEANRTRCRPCLRLEIGTVVQMLAPESGRQR